MQQLIISNIIAAPAAFGMHIIGEHCCTKRSPAHTRTPTHAGQRFIDGTRATTRAGVDVGRPSKAACGFLVQRSAVS